MKLNRRLIALVLVVVFLLVSLSVFAAEEPQMRRRGGKLEFTGLTVKSKAWRPDAMETFSWKKQRMRSDRLKRSESFLPRIKNSVKKDPF